MRRAQGSIVANPVLVGALTTLVIVVAVFLAYNANNGLPFVPTREYKLQISNGANLVPGNEVRSGGYRIGVVIDMKPVRLPSNEVGAEITMKLDQTTGALPTDTRAIIRPRSALGLKFVDLQVGKGSTKIPDGGTVPATQAEVPVELDEVYNIFDAETRDAAQRNLQGYGDTFADRGGDLNRLIEGLPQTLSVLEPVMRNLSDERTRLPQFFRALQNTASAIVPVSKVNAGGFAKMADTFEALGRDPKALQDTIAKGPPTLDAGTSSLEAQQPLYEDLALISRDIETVAEEARASLPTINRALAVGTPVTRRTTKLYPKLIDAMGELRRLVRAPTTSGAIRGLDATVTTLQPQLRFLGPYITVCNSWNLFWTFAAEHFTAPDSTGGTQRALLNSSDPTANDTLGDMGANEFVHGVQSPAPEGAAQQLHGNVFGSDAVYPDGRANCQAGNAGYLEKGNRFGPHGKLYEKAVVDSPTLKDFPNEPPLGPNFKTFNREGKGTGRTRDRVPAGQTFTDQPGGKGISP